MNSQRDNIYKKRRNALFGDRLPIDLAEIFDKVCADIVHTTKEGDDFIGQVIHFLLEKATDVSAFHTLPSLLNETVRSRLSATFSQQQELAALRPDFLFSIGGDGTFIDAANLVGDSGIPILGINTGRIGFLTNVNRNNFQEAYNFLQKSD